MDSKRDFSQEIKAYAFKNALEFGKADAGRILPKLFQHGLGKGQIKEIMPTIQRIVAEVNKFSVDEVRENFENFKKYVKEHEEKEKGLPELPGAVKGKVVVRVAPFPSGALHIGNAKTFLLNALYAEKYDGKILLVMDDTIGSVEKPIEPEAYKLIREGFDWLGINYDKKIIYKSDRLEKYYKYGEELIKKDSAYVCHCEADELRRNRALGKECGCRQFAKPIQILRWEEMFKAREGDATLRIKTDMEHPNPAFRDRVLFKISDREHPRVGKKYRVWPTLEMSWAVDDVDLGITHIIRGNDLMIETDMEKYIWDIFGWKHPHVFHTGMVNIEGIGAKISKSKSRAEVKSGEFTGWDDPRTWSLQSLKKRGISPIALRDFAEEFGLNKQDITVPIDALYSINRRLIDLEADRYSFVMEPIKLNIRDLPKSIKVATIPIHPEKKGERIIHLNDIFISREDFRKLKGKEIRLLHLFNIKLGDSEGSTSEFDSLALKDIPKINWVSENVKADVLMPDGKHLIGITEKSVKDLKVGQVIQFERFGFVCYQGVKDGEHEFWFAHK